MIKNMSEKTKTFEELHPEWEYECDKYAQEKQAKIQDINAMEIAFGNMREISNNEEFIMP
jgi:hypothetical protein